jgi:hypothetical protein
MRRQIVWRAPVALALVVALAGGVIAAAPPASASTAWELIGQATVDHVTLTAYACAPDQVNAGGTNPIQAFTVRVFRSPAATSSSEPIQTTINVSSGEAAGSGSWWAGAVQQFFPRAGAHGATYFTVHDDWIWADRVVSMTSKGATRRTDGNTGYLLVGFLPTCPPG